MQDLIYYYIIDRVNGVSYDPYFAGTRYLLAYSNRATDGTIKRIDISRLNKGLADRRYRLVLKSL